MRETRVSNSQELIALLHEFRGNRSWAFRGQNNAEWKLQPRAGRPDFATRYVRGISDRGMFESWKRYAVHYMTSRPKDEWDWLALAQHHGLATRLLDWTKNPLSAAFFAVHGNTGTDAAIFAFTLQTKDNVEDDDPFEVDGFKVYFPRGITARIVSQRGIFSVSDPPSLDIEAHLGDRLHKITIAGSGVADVVSSLDLFGMNKISAFQDLDHLSEYLNDYVLATDVNGGPVPSPTLEIPYG